MTNNIDFIGDIHGHADRLEALLTKLQYEKKQGVYKHSERTVVFVGDYIDRGPDNPGVVNIVRKMVDAGSAIALSGNHEFNAICFNTLTDKGYVRPHTIKNIKQHASTMLQYHGKQDQYDDAIKWFRTLPLYYETETFRAVHATWRDDAIKVLASNLNGETLTPEQFLQMQDENSPLFKAVDVTCKGIEASLPKGVSFFDKDKTERFDIRLKWWLNPDGKTVKDMSVIESIDIGNAMFESEDGSYYQESEKPVFFGHYWLKGKPKLYADNVCCLDYSVAKNGHLVAYRFSGEQKLSNENFVFV